MIDRLRDLRVRWRIHRWPRCACGAEKVAPRTATERGGWRHAEDECFRCDAFGNRSVW